MRDAHRMYATAVAGTRWWVRMMIHAYRFQAGYVLNDDRRAYARSIEWGAARGLLTPGRDRLAGPLMDALAMNAPHWWEHHAALRMHGGLRMVLAVLAVSGELEPARRILGGPRYTASLKGLHRLGLMHGGEMTDTGRAVVWLASTNRHYLGRMLAGFDDAIARITAGTSTVATSGGPVPTPSGRRPRS